MSEMRFNLIIAGVGGQGTLLAGKIIGQAALMASLDVKISEVHGMAQRGGSVITHVRAGQSVHAPLVSPGEADFLLAFEVLEGARSAYFLKPGGLLIVNTDRILPMPVITGSVPYPDDPLHSARNLYQVDEIDAMSAAVLAGNPQAVNMTLLGALSVKLPFSRDIWLGAISLSVPGKTLDTNLKAFDLGVNR